MANRKIADWGSRLEVYTVKSHYVRKNEKLMLQTELGRTLQTQTEQKTANIMNQTEQELTVSKGTRTNASDVKSLFAGFASKSCGATKRTSDPIHCLLFV